MAITYTEEQRELVKLVRDVARNEVMPYVAAADKAGECPRELYQWGFDLGLHMVEIPEQFGGMGLSYETCAMMFEELAWVDAAYADTFVTNFVAFRNILLNGTEEQARRFVEKTENNGFAAFCLTEANAGSDVAAMRTTAVLDGDRVRPNGTKTFITNGSISDIYVVFAKTDPEAGAHGITGFLIDGDTPGLAARRQGAQDGLPPVGHHGGRSRERARTEKRRHRGSRMRHVHRAERAEPLPGLHLDACRGHHAAGARRGRGLRQAAQAVRRRLIDFEMVQAMLADMAIKTEAGARPREQLHAPDGRRRDGAQGRRHREDLRHRRHAGGGEQRRAGARRLRLFRGVSVEKLMRDAKIFQIFRGIEPDPAHDHRQGARPGVPIS